MGKVRIVLDVYDEHADQSEAAGGTGLTEYAHDTITEALRPFGDDIEITEVD